MTLASPLGCSPDSLLRGLLTEKRGLSFDHRFRGWIAAPLGELPWVELGLKIEDPRETDLALHGASRVLVDQLNQEHNFLTRYTPEELGLFVGTTTSGINGFFRAAGLQKINGQNFEQLLKADMQQAWLAQELSDVFGLRGPSWTLSSSCAASAQALGLAYDALATGMLQAALVVGADILNLVTLLGFEALQVLDHELCRPFEAERGGINLGEAVVVLLLEKAPRSRPLNRIVAYHALSEGYHMTQPAPEGRWMRSAMEGALHKAQLSPADISYLNPHGTGTEANDRCEGQAIREVFGEKLRSHPSKRWTGHTLGAAGALEAAITSLFLNSEASTQAARSKSNFGLSNSFGFGGANVSIVFEGVV